MPPDQTRQSIPTYPVDTDIELPQRGAWPAAVHRFDAPQAAALRAAEAAGRPLLVRGLPGVGKSQLARAAAVAQGRRFAWAVIDGRTEAQDLQWRFDAVKRLADAQTKAGPDIPPQRYLSPGPLWAAFDWRGSLDWCRDTAGISPPDWMDEHPGQAPGQPAPAPADDKVVLLLDEIDKADADLPNALLEVLSGDGFTAQLPGLPRVCCPPGRRPLIVITTNEERELPPPFLRRCFVIELALPEDGPMLTAHLVTLARSHQAYRAKCDPAQATWQCSPAVLRAAADSLLAARQDARSQQAYVPATAEYLDLVRALATLFPGDETAQLKNLALLQDYALKKWVQAGPQG